MTAPHKKLIEVALPLEAINAENAREKILRAGHPSFSTLIQAKQAQRAAARAELPSWHRSPIAKVEDDNVELTEL